LRRHPGFLLRQGMPADGEQAFIPDRRGNRLDRYSFSVAPDGRSHRLYLRASPEIAGQFQGTGSPALTYRLVGDHVSGAQGWTHCLGAPGVPDARIRELADLLSEVITLPRLSAVEFAIAMDWYKVPADDIDPRKWRNTPDGERVHVGKYWTGSPQATAAAGRALVGRILGAVHRHLGLASADAVVAVPGHDSAYVSFGEQLGASVARGLGVPLIKTATQREFRPPAKDLPGSGIQALRGEFSIPANLAGAVVLIVDDVFRSGGTLSSVALAAQRAGAARACGLVAVRTMRS
jgi:adenine/guanine phosphoribosyltransferase-like PRPP-binding protein